MRVRASRDGDRFHYVWAAQRSLSLLDPSSRLREIGVEGARVALGDEEPEGTEVIDLIEYYGEPGDSFSEIVVRQFKHSTLHPDTPMRIPEAGKILAKFAALDDPVKGLPNIHPGAVLRYSIVTNRAFDATLISAIEAVARGDDLAEGSDGADLSERIGVSAERASAMCSRVDLDGQVESIDVLRPRFDVAVGEVAADTDYRAAAQLIELVAKRAGTEANDPIRAPAVAAALGTTIGDLRPAPSRIEDVPFVPRLGYSQIAEKILATKSPLLVTAGGGIGKSTFARAVPGLLEGRAAVVVYDCFGQGEYRSSDHPRHRHRDGLVQIASEMAALGLCGPIIPGSTAQSAEYLKSFVGRLETAAQALAADGSQHLVILIDAADNSVLAANESATGPSFVIDLLRLASPIPANVHIVLTSRPERLYLLQPPDDLETVELDGYNLAEAGEVVRRKFPEAGERDIAEFYSRTLGNPRVAAFALQGSISLRSCLEVLAGVSSGDATTLDALLARQVEVAFRESGHPRAQVGTLAQLITLLRPSIPTDILSSLSGIPESGIRSFASDLGRGLVVSNDTLQFQDEPTETFFRERFAPSPETAGAVIDDLRRLSGQSAYAAASLPEVMWNAGHVAALLQLAASDDALPVGNEVERRQIEHLRIEFGLRAALLERSADAVVELALKAGSTRAGSERRLAVLRDHPDFTGTSMDSRALNELLASRTLPADWPGSTLGAEAAMLAMSEDRLDSARSRIRLANAAIIGWAEQTAETRRTGRIEPKHLAMVVEALLRTEGPDAAAGYVARWGPARFVLEAAHEVARIRTSRAEFGVLDEFLAALAHPAAILGVLAEYQRLGVEISQETTRTLWERVSPFRGVALVSQEYDERQAEDQAMRGAALLASAAVRHQVASPADAALRLAALYPGGPPFGLGDRLGTGRKGLLLVIALRAELMDEVLSQDHFRPASPRAGSNGRHRAKSNDEDLREHLAPALPWLSAWSRLALGRLDVPEARTTVGTYPSIGWRQDGFTLALRLARQIAPLIAASCDDSETIDLFRGVLDRASAANPEAAALDMLPPLKGDPRFDKESLEVVRRARMSIHEGSDLAENKADALVLLARAVQPYSAREAQTIFDLAVSVASRAGEDLWYRWDAIVAIAGASPGCASVQASTLASRLAHVAEVTEPFLYDGLDEQKLTSTLADLEGPRVLSHLSQWRDRRFGNLDWQLGGIANLDRGILALDPRLAIILAPFSSRLSIPRALSSLAEHGDLSEQDSKAAGDLARRMGLPIDPVQAAVEVGIAAARETEDLSRGAVAGSAFDGGDERQAALGTLRERLDELDLAAPEGPGLAAEILHQESVHTMSPLVAALRGKSEYTWGDALLNMVSSDTFSTHQKAELLNEVMLWTSGSLGFADARRQAVEHYVAHEGTSLLLGNWPGLNTHLASTLLGLDERALHLEALNRVNIDEALTDAQHCYRLASSAARALQPHDAARVTLGALRALEADLDDNCLTELPPPYSAISIDVAIGNFLWAALGDPRSRMRWLASHALRTAIELDMRDVVHTICQCAVGSSEQGFADTRFPFYSMSAVEWFLLAVARADVVSAGVRTELGDAVSMVAALHPNHAAIQMHCAHASSRLKEDGATPAGTDWASVLAAPIACESWKRPQTPSPLTSDAPKSEYLVHFDLDEYMVANLTDALDVTHQEVLDAVSTTILDTWGWRGRPELDEDPRRVADVFGEGEAHVYKSEVPIAEDLDYYLVRHATLTVAGEMMRTQVPYCDPETRELDILSWLASFDIARDDRLWVSDLRTPLPAELANMVPEDAQAGWREEDAFGGLVAALFPRHGWVTVSQFASAKRYDRHADLDITSALVNPDTSAALARSLQTGGVRAAFQLPTGDDASDEDERTIHEPPFALLGWLARPRVYSGIDLDDPYAANLVPVLTRPSEAVIRDLGLRVRDGGMGWTTGDRLPSALVAETWSTMAEGRDPDGAHGHRLRVSSGVLDRLLSRVNMDLIVAVHSRRDDRQSLQEMRVAKTGGYEDRGDQSRIFTYRPGTGWRDYRGRPVIGAGVGVGT